MRYFFAALAAIFFAFLFVATADARDLTKMQDQALSMTAQLNGNCSATLIHSARDEKSGKVETIFLTAKHCIDSAKKDQVLDLPVYQNGRVVKKDRYIARHRGSWFKGDLALVELKDTQTFFEHTATIAPDGEVPVMGAEVVTVGYPLSLQLTVTPGVFGSYETLDYPTDGVEYFRATPDVVGGNSGGALYRITPDGDYEIIGVTSAGMRGYSYMTFYVPLDQIHDYLKVAVPAAVGADKDK